jgi:type II secretion system protein H
MRQIPSSTGIRNAFTLIELMVVVALIAIMTAMILPEMTGTYQDALLRSTSRELVNAFNLAYSRAVSFNQPHRVRIEPGTGKYFVEKRVVEHGRADFVSLRDVPGGEGKLDTRISVEIQMAGESMAEETGASTDREESPVLGQEDVITFYCDGTADAKEVVLQDRQGFRLALRINPTTARVHVVELARK